MAGTITHKWNGTVLTITSDSGTSSADLKGAKGDDGARGAQGIPGTTATIAPIVDVVKEGSTTTITVTDAEGTKTASVKDGVSPVRGVDYWTAADKAEIVSECAAPSFVTNTSEMTDTSRIYIKDNYIWVYSGGAWVNTGQSYIPQDLSEDIAALEAEVNALSREVSSIDNLEESIFGGAYLSRNFSWESGYIYYEDGEIYPSERYEETTDFIFLPIGAIITNTKSNSWVYEYDVNTKAYIGKLKTLSNGDTYTATENKLVRITSAHDADIYITFPTIETRLNTLTVDVDEIETKFDELEESIYGEATLIETDWVYGRINLQTGELEESSELEETTDYTELPRGSVITASGSPVYIYSYDTVTKEYIKRVASLTDGQTYITTDTELLRITCGQEATVFINKTSIDSRLDELEKNISEMETGKPVLLFSGEATEGTFLHNAKDYTILFVKFELRCRWDSTDYIHKTTNVILDTSENQNFRYIIEEKPVIFLGYSLWIKNDGASFSTARQGKVLDITNTSSPYKNIYNSYDGTNNGFSPIVKEIYGI